MIPGDHFLDRRGTVPFIRNHDVGQLMMDFPAFAAAQASDRQRPRYPIAFYHFTAARPNHNETTAANRTHV